MTKLYLAGTYGEINSGGGRLDGLLMNRGTFDSDIPSGRQRKEGLVAPELHVACRERERVKATRKDTFDHDILERGWRADDMGAIETRGGFDLDIASKVNLLESFYYVADWQTRNLHRFKSFLLDSGGFTLRRGKGNVPDWNEYLNSYIRYIRDNDVRLFFDLDIDEEVGYDNVVLMRKKLERETGRQCIPVWHESYGKQEWFNLCDEYSYVALGGLALAAGRRRMEKYVPWFIDEAHKRGTRVHVLGYTPTDGKLEGSGIDSCDSTAWLYGNRGGFVYYWDGRRMQKISKPKGKRLDGKQVARHNFMQWVKMGEYFEGR